LPADGALSLTSAVPAVIASGFTLPRPPNSSPRLSLPRFCVTLIRSRRPGSLRRDSFSHPPLPPVPPPFYSPLPFPPISLPPTSPGPHLVYSPLLLPLTRFWGIPNHLPCKPSPTALLYCVDNPLIVPGSLPSHITEGISTRIGYYRGLAPTKRARTSLFLRRAGDHTA